MLSEKNQSTEPCIQHGLHCIKNWLEKGLERSQNVLIFRWQIIGDFFLVFKFSRCGLASYITGVSKLFL